MAAELEIRNHVDFNWREMSTSSPPGLEIAKFLRATLAATCDVVDPLAERSAYGWEFQVRTEEVRLLVILQEVERWLVTIHPLGGLYALFRWWRGGDAQAALEKACQALHAALVNDRTFSHLRWYTRREFDERLQDPPPGSPVPGRA